jgi:hypothetical protein
MPTTISNDTSIADIAPTLEDGAVFAAQVRHRMIQEQKLHGAVVARVGVTGKGVAPNFRIDTVSGQQSSLMTVRVMSPSSNSIHMIKIGALLA